MLLRVFCKKSAKGSPWIALKRFSAATRLSVGNRVGAERVAGYV